MVTIDKKKETVRELVAKLDGATGVYLVGFEGMSVEQTLSFRRALKAKGLVFKVAKNTLLKRAIEEKGGIDIPAEKYATASGLVLGYEDAVAPAKIIKEFFDKGEKPFLKAAVIENQYFDGSELKAVASLPTREDMIAAIVGSLHAPITGIVGSVNAVMRDLASVIEEVAKKQNAA